MVSLFVGSFVGMVAGFNISLVARILYLPEKKSNNKTTKRSNDSLNTYSDWKRVKREPYSASISPDTHTTRLSTDDGTISQKTPDITTVKPEKPFFSLPQMPDAGDFSSEAIFEDDDGYNFMTYKISDERHSQTKRESFAKKRESRQRSIPPSLQMTIEEESESEITPTPTHATTAVTPTNSVSLDYATGTIGSSKTYSTDSSVFSKKIGVSRSEAKDETLQDSPEDDTELSAEEIDNKVQNRSKSGPSEKSRVPHVHTQELPNLEETVNPEVGGKEGQNPSHKDCPASNKKAEK
ncbi:hypothetical protein JCM33374_g5874 [Metschnikowia sp. JCM 33374]|nr:hypothetical protein JCM33374_g5874 [Metschnikowia sp. JCM 33374]